MKIRLTLMILFLCIACKADSVRITKIEIEYVNLDLEATYKIECDSFKSEFKGMIKKKVISNKQELDKFLECLYQNKADKDLYLPDVRVRIKIFKSNNVLEYLCTDGDKSGAYNGQAVVLKSNLVNMIKGFINN